MIDNDDPRPSSRLRALFDFLENPRLRTRFFWTVLAVAVVASLVAVLTTGVARRLGSLVLELSFLAVLLPLLRYPYSDRVDIEDIFTTKTPRQKLQSMLQVVLLILYNIGIMLVVLSFLVRFGAIPLLFPVAAQTWFPFALVVYLVVLAITARLHVEGHGRQEPTWYSRTAAGFTWIMGGLVALLAVVMLFVPQFSIGALLVRETELLVLVLIVGLSVATLLFFVAGIPTAYDVIIAMFQKEQGAVKAQTPPIVYAALVAIIATVAVGFIAARTGIIQAVGNALSSQQGAYILILLPVALAAFSLYSSISIYREGRVGLYKKRIPTKLRNDIMVFGSSAMLGSFFSVASFMVITGRWDHIGPFATDLDTAKDLIMITILVTVGPIGVYMSRQIRRIDNIEARLPDFLNDLAETRRAGLTMTASLHTSARIDYGPLTAEVKRMSNQVAWGIPFTDALQMFSKRVKSSLVERSTNLIIESSKTGGSVAAILKAAADDAREIKGLEQERKTTLATYLIVIYVTFFVFLTVIAVLDNAFIPQVVEAQEKILSAEGAQSAGGLGNAISDTLLDQDALRFTYFNAAVIQSIGNGMVGGLLMDQRLTSGFRHVAVMTFAAWILFRWLLAF